MAEQRPHFHGHPTTALTEDCIRILEGAGYTVVPPGPSHSMTTYRRADDELWLGEYEFLGVDDGIQESAEDEGEPLEVIVETWALKERKVVTYKPAGWDELQAELAEERRQDEAAPG